MGFKTIGIGVYPLHPHIISGAQQPLVIGFTELMNTYYIASLDLFLNHWIKTETKYKHFCEFNPNLGNSECHAETFHNLFIVAYH